MSRWLERLWYPEEAEARAAPAWSAPLRALSAGFGATVAVRNALYDRGVLASARVSGARVVSVGNLNVGGAGKTPAALFLADWALRCGRTVAVLSRGYGRDNSEDRLVKGPDLPSAEEVGDEPRLLAARLPGLVVLVGPDRARLAQRARDQFGADFILLDDGMQHRRLARDVEVVVVDEDAGFGNGRVLPAGPLREPVTALARADVVWLRAGQRPRALALPPGRVVRVAHEVRWLVAPDGDLSPVEALRGVKVAAVCGIARPGSFLGALRAAGADVAWEQTFPDHHLFSEDEVRALADQAERLGARLVTTEKDLMRLPPRLGAWALRVEVRVLEGLEKLATVLGLDERCSPDRAPAAG